MKEFCPFVDSFIDLTALAEEADGCNETDPTFEVFNSWTEIVECETSCEGDAFIEVQRLNEKFETDCFQYRRKQND